MNSSSFPIPLLIENITAKNSIKPVHLLKDFFWKQFTRKILVIQKFEEKKNGEKTQFRIQFYTAKWID